MAGAWCSTYHFPEVRVPSVTPQTFRRLALASVFSYALLVATGGAVRLTGSGLGCPDWPSCYHSRLTAAMSFHPLIEFGNRLVTVAVSIISIVVFLAAFGLHERRRDLRILSGGLVVGLLAQIVLGGLVVHFNLNPYLVALHFLLTLAVLGDAIVLHERSRTPSGERRLVVGREIVWFTRLQLAVLSVLLMVGTLVTGAGPHAGGPGAKRIAVAFRDIAELHSTIALFLIGLVIGALFALYQAKAPAVVQQRARTMLEVLALQGVVGFTQYFLHDAPWLVEIHLVGATAAFSAAALLHLSLYVPDPAGPLGGGAVARVDVAQPA